MTTLLLIRHGQSEANSQGIFAGQIDPDLLSRGLEQAKVTAEYISKHYQIDGIYSSDLRRAYKTAMCLAQVLDMPVVQDKNLREVDAGQWEGMKYDDLVAMYPEEYHIWIHHIGRSHCVGGESIPQLGSRVMNTLTKIARENEGKTIAIATHATPIRAAQSMIKTGSLEEMENIPWVSNASITILEYEDPTWKIIAESVDEHLAELKTVLPANV